VLALFSQGCKPQYSDFFPYHDDGTPKPNVVLMPVIAACETQIPWNLSQEFSSDVRTSIMRNGKLFVPTQQELRQAASSVSTRELTSAKDLMPFLYFQPAHFVVVMELIEHKQVPYQRGKTKPLYLANVPEREAKVLMIKVRLKIVDIRGGDPKLIRQEIVQSNHMIPEDGIQESVQKHGKEGFPNSPLGLAYGRCIRDIVEKIERVTSFQR